MKINKFTYSYTRSVQMRQFEPVQVFMSVETQLDPGEKFVAVAAKVKHMVKEEVELEIKKLKRERIESLDDEMEKST